MAESSHVLAFWSVMMSLKWRTGLAMLGCCTRKAQMADVPAVCESECRRERRRMCGDSPLTLCRVDDEDGRVLGRDEPRAGVSGDGILLVRLIENQEQDDDV